eukprot:TRINITY_DN17892_c0_g1_i1.p1 TRINITY_DN17892_c0_g1~~TRINITY_DN17892_c0_g1_i1.p1  ORF type:complete len:311 (-),score=21.03 TRINITY_DN17892_c0_g1_i1:3030-3848(-)
MDVKVVFLAILVLSSIVIIPYLVQTNSEQQVNLSQNANVIVSFAAPLPKCQNNQGKTVLIDLGANCGNSFYDLQKKHGPFNRSYLWELNPFLFPALEELISKNENVTFIPYGAWHKEENITLDIIGNQVSKCDLSESFWDGTTFIDTKYTDKKHQWNDRYNSTIHTKTIIFVDWYQQNICQQDEVTLKIDIEKAEFGVLAHMVSAGLLCHPKNLLLEFHNLRSPPKTDQQFKQKSEVQNQELREKCFTSGFITSLEMLIGFCQQQPILHQWY